MAMTNHANPQGPRQHDAFLPCGRSVDETWENISQPPDPHQLTCPFCRDARAALQRLQQATQDLLAHDTTDPDFHVSPRIKRSVLEVARNEARRSRMLPLIQPSIGQPKPTLTISELELSSQIRDAADQLPGIHARRCVVTIDPTGDTSQHTEKPASITINLRTAVSAQTNIPQAMTQLRRTIIDRISRRAGLTVTTIEVHVEDIYDA
ncbi:Asp23/Gls24 family envelope stress response protein [Microlunatus sp. Gsoil 973]|uniref:Asp23/Gls24 family envelope stress response protein n=1 Tax=Microlunatus sp. Gsoil 973 TaxID=2672569 RepID=UPI0012B45B67|nr:Asp23/Gls24 family envelope stress response protein [Microlunatus sp. Gsoil 973]QGN32107.1 hypothetical protein GJV80_04075 [Microlunatus sp. Gsoil 973]